MSGADDGGPRGDPDRRRDAAVRPPGWRNPEPARRYDLVVVGAGTAGLVTASIAASLGARVALVERERMGGDCLNVGCVPSKALLAAARAAADARAAGRLGVDVPPGAAVDFPRVMRRMREVRADIAPHDGAARFAAMGVDVFFGAGRFTARDALEVAGARLAFAKAVVATGARPALPPVAGLAEANPLTNETVFDLERLPPRLAVIGGGPIGVELAQAFARFGSRVTLFEQGPRILPRDDADAAAVVAAALAHDGVEVRLGARLARVETRGGELALHAGGAGDAPGGEAVPPRGGGSGASAHDGAPAGDAVAVDALLVAAGRRPHVDGLGLDAAGVDHDARRGLVVDDHLRTSNPRIYAAGDVGSPYQFTHAADFMARLVVQNALFAVGSLGRKRASALTIPWCTYTDPELAHVGLTAEAAADHGIAIDTYTEPLAANDRARLEGDHAGFVRLHVRRGRDRIVGATIVARHAGELISELTLAMRAGLGLAVVADTIHPYPTRSDAIRAAANRYTRSRLTPAAARLLKLLLRFNT